jgi:hypothetical protein
MRLSDPGFRVCSCASHPFKRRALGATRLDIALSLHSIVVASEQQVSCQLGEESAILNMKNSVYYGLDPVGARIWGLLRQPRSITDVCDAIVDEYDVERERCERDVLELLEKMRSEGLIELCGKP